MVEPLTTDSTGEHQHGEYWEMRIEENREIILENVVSERSLPDIEAVCPTVSETAHSEALLPSLYNEPEEAERVGTTTETS